LKHDLASELALPDVDNLGQAGKIYPTERRRRNISLREFIFEKQALIEIYVSYANNSSSARMLVECVVFRRSRKSIA